MCVTSPRPKQKVHKTIEYRLHWANGSKPPYHLSAHDRRGRGYLLRGCPRRWMVGRGIDEGRCHNRKCRWRRRGTGWPSSSIRGPDSHGERLWFLCNVVLWEIEMDRGWLVILLAGDIIYFLVWGEKWKEMYAQSVSHWHHIPWACLNNSSQSS